MTEKQKEQILEKAKQFFKNTIMTNHIRNCELAGSLRDYNVNPFLVHYLAAFRSGDTKPRDIAEALLLPRILGTSITTSFGQNFQDFVTTLKEVVGSVTEGIDVEFVDHVDKRKKYAQIKAGPTTINGKDVEPMLKEFKHIKKLARTNNKEVNSDDIVVGVLYGREDDLSAHYRKIKESHSVYIGGEFWHRLTGDQEFYVTLISAIEEVAKKADGRKHIEKALGQLTREIEEQGI